MPKLLDGHRQRTTMTQQFRTTEEKRKGSDDDDSLPPNWGRFQDPSTGRCIFCHSTTHEVVFKMKHLFNKLGARKNRPDAATPPSKKKKKIKAETEAAAPDVIPFIPVQSGGTNSMDPIELLDSDSSRSNAKNEELSDLSETEAPCVPKPDNFQLEDSGSGSNGLRTQRTFSAFRLCRKLRPSNPVRAPQTMGTVTMMVQGNLKSTAHS
jgi:hypothetical protein